jgi:hypothetical protein
MPIRRRAIAQEPLIKWVTTPTCKECPHWDWRKKECKLTECVYPNKR